MRNWIMHWIASALALFLIANLGKITGFPIGIHVNSVGALLVAVIALGFVNSFIRPIIMFFAWPINCLTFGLMGFAINVILFWVVGSGFIPGFKVDGPMAALVGSVLMGILSGLFSALLSKRDD